MDDNRIAEAAAELVGTLTLTFFAAGALIVDAAPSLDEGLGPLGIAALAGIGYTLATAIARQRSQGHVNPAITVAAWLTARLSIGRAASYVAAQLAGAGLAVAVLTALNPAEALSATGSGATTVSSSLGLLTAITWEIVATALYALVVFATVLDADRDWGAFAVGLAVFGAVAVAAPFTGASLNPARSLGSTLFAGDWSRHWVHWVGPILGAGLAAGVHDGLLRAAET